MGRSPYAAMLDLDLVGAGPLHARLTRAVRVAIRTGASRSGAAVPPSRALAEELGCSRWVVTEAYGQLIAEGYLDATVGVGDPGRVVARRRRRPGGGRSAGPPRPPARYDLAPACPTCAASRAAAGRRRCGRSPADAVTTSWACPTRTGTPSCGRPSTDYLRAAGARDRPRRSRDGHAPGVTDGAGPGLPGAGARPGTPPWPWRTRAGRGCAAAVRGGRTRAVPVGVDDDGLRVAT